MLYGPYCQSSYLTFSLSDKNFHYRGQFLFFLIKDPTEPRFFILIRLSYTDFLCGIIPQALKVFYHTSKCSVSQQKEFVNSINCISYLSLMTSKCLFVMLNQKLDVYTLSYMYSNTILTLLASGYMNNK